jgi:RsmE family RNA methyltransferase
MNLLLLTDSDLLSPTVADLSDKRRLDHILKVLKPQLGERLTVGRLNGDWGTGEVTELSRDRIRLSLTLNRPPPEPLRLTLVLALPRPQQIKRILQTVAGSGVKELHLIHSRRVEKSYWQSPSIHPDAVETQLQLGLEQGCDTAMPQVHYHRQFKPFVEDTLPGLIEGRRAMVAHPYDAIACPAQVQEPVTLLVGPEGGFNEYEIGRLSELGVQAVHLGPRILKTEVAIPYLLGRLF